MGGWSTVAPDEFAVPAHPVATAVTTITARAARRGFMGTVDRLSLKEAFRRQRDHLLMSSAAHGPRRSGLDQANLGRRTVAARTWRRPQPCRSLPVPRHRLAKRPGSKGQERAGTGPGTKAGPGVRAAAVMRPEHWWRILPGRTASRGLRAEEDSAEQERGGTGRPRRQVQAGADLVSAGRGRRAARPLDHVGAAWPAADDG